MEDLIEALQIFKKYQQPTKWPTICSHDTLTIAGVGRIESKEDEARLNQLGFFFDDSQECWRSYVFGSARNSPNVRRAVAGPGVTLRKMKS